MQLISFLVLILGNVFVVRTMFVFRARNLLSESHVTKIGALALAAQLASAFWQQNKLIDLILCQFILIFIDVLSCHFLEYQEVSRFKVQVPVFLDRWILNVRLGKSITAARDEALLAECDRFQQLIRPLFETRQMVVGQHLLFSFNECKELNQISLSQHTALDRLQNLREQMKKTAEFRRKSGNAVLQSGIQAGVMVVLILALSALVLQRYGWSQCGDLVLLSYGLSLLGVWLMMRLSRKVQWKV